MEKIESIPHRILWLLAGSLAGGAVATLVQAIFDEVVPADRAFATLSIFIISIFLMFIDKWKNKRKLLIYSFTFSVLMNLLSLFKDSF